MSEWSEIDVLLTRLVVIDFSQSSDQATREMAVNPVIGALGWNTFNPDEVAREFSVLGGRVDYCLRGQMRNLVLIEVKRAGTDLSEHQEQLLRYAFDEGAPLAALTDGLVWWLYLPMAGGSWEQRRFFQIDFRERASADAAMAIHRFLNRDGVIDGTALEEAQREFESQERDRRVLVALQEAWRRVLGDPQGLLRDLLSETVQEISGVVPDREALAEFLREVSGSETTERAAAVLSPRSDERHPRAAQEAHGAYDHPAAVEVRDSDGDFRAGREAPSVAANLRSGAGRRTPRRATRRMSAWVERGHLSVRFADDQMETWELPDRSDKGAIRRVRDTAVAFARENQATLGQINAVKKALTEAGYYLTKPRSR